MTEIIETNDKKTWENGDIIDAISLNNIEDAIAVPYGVEMAIVTSVYDNSTGTTTYACNKTSNEIFDIMKHGSTVVVYFDDYYIEEGQRFWNESFYGDMIYEFDADGAHFFFDGANWWIDSEGNVATGGLS